MFDKVQDSGKREEYTTGSRRDTQSGKGRPDLMPTMPLRRLAQHFENGADKYGDRNWEKGQPLSRYYASAQRHLWSMIEKKEDEDHYAAAMWNVMCMMQTIEWIQEGKLPRELDDLDLTQIASSASHYIDMLETIEQFEDVGHPYIGEATHKSYRINNEDVTFDRKSSIDRPREDTIDQQIAREYTSAIDKHPDYPTLHHALAVIREEYLEVEALAFKQYVNFPRLKEELLHLIVTAIRTLEYIGNNE